MALVSLKADLRTQPCAHGVTPRLSRVRSCPAATLPPTRDPARLPWHRVHVLREEWQDLGHEFARVA